MIEPTLPCAIGQSCAGCDALDDCENFGDPSDPRLEGLGSDEHDAAELAQKPVMNTRGLDYETAARRRKPDLPGYGTRTEPPDDEAEYDERTDPEYLAAMAENEADRRANR